MTNDNGLYLGLDVSTQSMTGVITNSKGKVIHEHMFRFDVRYQKYGITNGVIIDGTKPNEVLIPSLMFVEALDDLLQDLSKCDLFQMSDIIGVSGSAQQHGSVFWSKAFSLSTFFNKANPEEPLTDAMSKENPFALACGASWMDSSTTKFCEELEKDAGGADTVAAISGSRAYERFTGNQIAKRIANDPDFFDKCGRIALVSSMMTSLLIGDFALIDDSDASGMNLLDVRAKEWSPVLLKSVAKYSNAPNATELLHKALGEGVSKPFDVVGIMHPYFQQRYGFSNSCKVIPFSGDNPCSLAGIGLAKAGDVGLSLGTSSTLMAVVPASVSKFSADEGHFFTNPTNSDTHMAMICFKNGALTREAIRDRCANSSWETFEKLMGETNVGNDGKVAIYYTHAEITPSTAKAGEIGFNEKDERVDPRTSFSPAVEVRAVAESQFLSLRVHAEKLGVVAPKKLIVVGGASANKSLLRMLADVFNAPAYVLETVGNSAALGGAFRAQHGLACEESYVQYDVENSLELTLAASPEEKNVAIYNEMVPRFIQLEALAVKELS